MIFYECKFCNKLYKSEKAFIKHNCKQRVRHVISGTIEGQIAFGLYDKWLFMRHGRYADQDLFKSSRFYNAFISFAKYYKNIKGLPNVDEFIGLMIKLDILPASWTNQKVLSYYLTEMDNQQPIEKIKKTIDSLDKLANAYECDITDVFEYLEFDTLVSFLKLFKLSPWILLNSKKFMKWLSTLPWEQQYLMDNVIDCDRWKNIFSNDPKNLKFAKQCIIELGI